MTKYSTQKVYFFTLYETKKIRMFCLGKDNTERNLVRHLNEHGSCNYHLMYQYFAKNEQFGDILSLMKLPDIDSMTITIDKREYLLNAVLFNFRVEES